jgi:UDP-galactopyranose mutase
MNSLISKSYLIKILKDHNYAVDKEDDIPDDMYALFCEKMEEQMREAIRVALVSADNEQRKELKDPKDIEAILIQQKLFVKKKE